MVARKHNPKKERHLLLFSPTSFFFLTPLLPPSLPPPHPTHHASSVYLQLILGCVLLLLALLVLLGQLKRLFGILLDEFRQVLQVALALIVDGGLGACWVKQHSGETLDVQCLVLIGCAIKLGDDDRVDLLEALGQLFVGGQKGLAVATPVDVGFIVMEGVVVMGTKQRVGDSGCSMCVLHVQTMRSASWKHTRPFTHKNNHTHRPKKQHTMVRAPPA